MTTLTLASLSPIVPVLVMSGTAVLLMLLISFVRSHLLTMLLGLTAVVAAMAPAILIIVHFLLGFSSIGPIGPLVGQVD